MNDVETHHLSYIGLIGQKRNILFFSSSYIFKGDPHLGRSPPPIVFCVSLCILFSLFCCCCSPLKTMLYNMLSLWEKLSQPNYMAGLFKKSSVALSLSLEMMMMMMDFEPHQNMHTVLKQSLFLKEKELPGYLGNA